MQHRTAREDHRDVNAANYTLLASGCFTPTREQLSTASIEYWCARLDTHSALVRDASVIAFCAADCSSIPQDVMVEHTYFVDIQWYD